jgi:hypothetical protein
MCVQGKHAQQLREQQVLPHHANRCSICASMGNAAIAAK